MDFDYSVYFWLFLFASHGSVQCVEEAQREIYLRPRNFNPHPYQVNLIRQQQQQQEQQLQQFQQFQQIRRIGQDDRGPIQFPPSPSPDIQQSNFIRVQPAPDHANLILRSHPVRVDVDDHPYQKIAQKYRHRNPGRHQEYENNNNEIKPVVSNALAAHARKVLGHPVVQDSESPQKNFLNDVHRNDYAFSYKVVDHSTGDDFSHTQSQNEKSTRGEYRVKLPDGRLQIVSYTADKNGYNADVKYQDGEDDRPLPPRPPQLPQVQPLEHFTTNVSPPPPPPLPTQPTIYKNYHHHRPTQQPTTIFFTPSSVHGSPIYQHRNYGNGNGIIPNDKVEIVNQGAPGLTYLDHPAINGITLAPSSTAVPQIFLQNDDYQQQQFYIPQFYKK